MLLRKSFFALLLITSGFASGKTLTIGYFQPVPYLDPHQGNYDAILQLSGQIFQHLVHRDSDFKIQYDLAESLTPISDTEWQVDLNKNAVFSDGSPVTANDVKCTFDRTKMFKQGIVIHTGMVKDVTIKSKTVAVLKTNFPYPELPKNLVYVQIMSCKQVGIDSTKPVPWNQMVGSGPYMVRELTKEKLVLERNPYYGGTKPEWDSVIYRFDIDFYELANALQKGDIDLATFGGGNDPDVAQISRLKNDSRFKIEQTGSYFMSFIAFDHYRTGAHDVDNELNYLTQKSGAHLDNNPLRELKFRKALSLAIDRNRYTTDFVSPIGYIGTGNTEGLSLNDLTAPAQDLKLANKLIDELATEKPEYSYLKNRDLKIQLYDLDEIVAAGWKTLGFDVAEGGSGKFEFQIKQQVWGLDTGDLSSTIVSQFATKTVRPGWGNSNWGRYSNPELDSLLAIALEEKNESKRNTLLKQTTDLAMNDYAILPLRTMKAVWMMKKDLCYKPRYDAHTYATEVTTCP